jgi:hypothetical protein
MFDDNDAMGNEGQQAPMIIGETRRDDTSCRRKCVCFAMGVRGSTGPSYFSIQNSGSAFCVRGRSRRDRQKLADDDRRLAVEDVG